MPSPPPRPSKRRQVRERVLQALFAFELSGDSAEHVLATVITPTFEGERVYADFARKLFLRAADARAEADTLVERHLQNWELSRLALTDRLVLWMAIAEFLYFEDIPPKVTLNEAVEVARAFGSDNSAGFVNGVLDAVLRDLRDAGRISKTGRGLVDAAPRVPRPKPADPATEPSVVTAAPADAPEPAVAELAVPEPVAPAPDAA